MFHYVNDVHNSQGQALPGYYVKLSDMTTGAVIPLYSDASSTPIVSASGLANAAKVDPDGQVSFFVAEGTYNLDLYSTNGTTLRKRIPSVPFGDQGQPVITADLPFGGFKATSLADAVSPQDAVNLRTADARYAPIGSGGGGSVDPTLIAAYTFATAAGVAFATGVVSIDTIGYNAPGDGGGASYIYDAAVNSAYVTANPRTSFMATGSRGFRLDPSQRLTIEMFGGSASYVNSSNRGTDNYAAIMAACQLKPDSTREFAPPVQLGVGAYWCSATLEPKLAFSLFGHNPGVFSGAAIGGSATRLVFPTNTLCLIVAGLSTTGATSTTAGTRPASTSRIRGITFEQETQGTDLTAHAILARGSVEIENCSYVNIAGDGERFSANVSGTPLGNANGWVSINNYAHSCAGNGHYALGTDSNAGYCRGLQTQTIGLCGIRDDASFVNTYVGCQMTGYGTGGVQYGGRKWQPIADSTNQTPSNTSLYWVDRGALASPNTAFPAWSSATAYKAVGPFIASNGVVVEGLYQEGGATYGYCHAPNAQIIGGNAQWTALSPAQTAQQSLGSTNVQGVGHYRSTGGDTTHPAYAAIGNEEWTTVGSYDPSYTNDITKRASMMWHRVNSKDWVWRYNNNSNNQEARYLGGPLSFTITGYDTTNTNFGLSTNQFGAFVLHDHVVADASAAHANTGRFHRGSASGAPTTGEHAQGEFVWNLYNPGAGVLGWSCTGTGTPGTWTAVSLGGFSGTYTSDANFGNLTVGGATDGKVLRTSNSSGYGIQFSMNASGSLAYMQNLKPGTGYSEIDIIATPLVVLHDGTEVARSRTNGWQIASGMGLYVGGTKVVGAQQTSTAANATDLATALTLVNDLKAKLIAHGLIS